MEALRTFRDTELDSVARDLVTGYHFFVGQFAPLVTAPSLGRRLVGQLLPRILKCSDEDIENLQLIVSELVTNAVCYSQLPGFFILGFTHMIPYDRFMLQVIDLGSRPIPTVRIDPADPQTLDNTAQLPYQWADTLDGDALECHRGYLLIRELIAQSPFSFRSWRYHALNRAQITCSVTHGSDSASPWQPCQPLSVARTKILCLTN